MNDDMMSMNAFCVVVCLLTCLKYFHYYPKYGILVRTITKAAPHLSTFMLMVRCSGDIHCSRLQAVERIYLNDTLNRTPHVSWLLMAVPALNLLGGWAG